MNYLQFYKNRLELNLCLVEVLLMDEELFNDYVNMDNRSKLEAEILKLLNTNYQDGELYDLKNKLEIISMLQEFKEDCQKIKNYQEDELIEYILQLEKYIRNQHSYIEEQTLLISARERFDIMEIMFRNIRKDYQHLYVVKAIKKQALAYLKSFNSPKSKLAYIFSDF